VLIFSWEENYGVDPQQVKTMDGVKVVESPFSSTLRSIKQSVLVIKGHPAILLLGLSQAFFEGGMYTFGKILLYIYKKV
jgi:hypothetical protein